MAIQIGATPEYIKRLQPIIVRCEDLFGLEKEIENFSNKILEWDPLKDQREVYEGKRKLGGWQLAVGAGINEMMHKDIRGIIIRKSKYNKFPLNASVAVEVDRNLHSDFEEHIGLFLEGMFRSPEYGLALYKIGIWDKIFERYRNIADKLDGNKYFGYYSKSYWGKVENMIIMEYSFFIKASSFEKHFDSNLGRSKVVNTSETQGD